MRRTAATKRIVLRFSVAQEAASKTKRGVLMKYAFAAASAALMLSVPALAGDEKTEWTELTEAQFKAMNEHSAGEWLGEGQSMGPDYQMVANTTRVRMTFEGGVLSGEWDEGDDGTWEGSWTETYTSGGYTMTGTDMEAADVKVYMANFEGGDSYDMKAKWTGTGPDGKSYDMKVYMSVDGDEGTRKLKVREAGTEGDWMVVEDMSMRKVDPTS